MMDKRRKIDLEFDRIKEDKAKSKSFFSELKLDQDEGPKHYLQTI